MHEGTFSPVTMHYAIGLAVSCAAIIVGILVEILIYIKKLRDLRDENE